ncbi:hypothetical protein LINPERPRIM_LOCUS32381 [Linum perenne]
MPRLQEMRQGEMLLIIFIEQEEQEGSPFLGRNVMLPTLLSQKSDLFCKSTRMN